MGEAATTFQYNTDENGNPLPTPYRISITGHKMLLRRDRSNIERYKVGESQSCESSIDIPGLNCDAQAILESLEKETPCYTCTVLAVGPRCNTTRDMNEYRKFQLHDRTRVTRHRYRGKLYMIPRSIVNPSRPGDRVLVRETSRVGRRWRGIAEREYDLITDEADILAIVPQEYLHAG